MSLNFFRRIPDPEPPAPLEPFHFILEETDGIDGVAEEIAFTLNNILLFLEPIGENWNQDSLPAVFSSPGPGLTR